MPKMKSHRGSAKRFKRTASGGLKRSQDILAIYLLTNHKNKSVSFANQQWYLKVI